MNERFKELTIRALAQCDPTKMTPLSSSVDNGDGVDIPVEFTEKVIRLIVQECISVCENEGYRLSMDTKTEHHRDLAKQCHKICAIIEKHFGVEK